MSTDIEMVTPAEEIAACSLTAEVAGRLHVDEKHIDIKRARYVVDIFLGTQTLDSDMSLKVAPFDRNQVIGFGVTRQELLTVELVPAVVFDKGHVAMIEAIGRVLVDDTMEQKTVFEFIVDIAVVMFRHGHRPTK